MKFDRKNNPKLSAASEAGFTFEPVYPNGQGIGATITVRGPESAQVRAVLRRQLAELQTRELQAKKRGKEPDAPGLEELEAQAIELAVAYTITWTGFEDGGVPMDPTEANFRAIYADYSWIRRQVIDEAQDLGNFAQSLSKPCSPTPAPNLSSI